MHGDASPRKTPDGPSGSGYPSGSGVPVGSDGAIAFATLIVANVALAFGPWFVRAADTGPVAAAFWRIALAVLMLALLAGAGGAPPQRLALPLWAPLIGFALVSQVLVSQVPGQGCMIHALGRLSPLVVGIALLIQPVVAGTVGWIVYDERLGAVDLAGVAMVAVALVPVRRTPRLARAPAASHLDD